MFNRVYHTADLPNHAKEEDRTVRFHNDISNEGLIQILDKLIENSLSEYLQNMSVETSVNQR